MTRVWAWTSVVSVALTTSLSAQTPPPPPVHDTAALEGTMKKFYKAANTIVVETIDGIEHVYTFTKDLVVHGGKHAGIDLLSGLQPGTTVVVHYSGEGARASTEEVDVVGEEGLKITEGVVAKIDRRKAVITVKYANGTAEVFRLTDRAAAEGGGGTTTAGSKVVVYYTDDIGRKVVHYFKTVP